ncbi:hypothetical protein THRCLA_20079, partial [Thraustotheca clavata]
MYQTVLGVLAASGAVYGQAGDTSQLQTAVLTTSSATYYGTYSYDPLGSGQWGGDLPAQENEIKTTLITLSSMTTGSNVYGCDASSLTSVKQKL